MPYGQNGHVGACFQQSLGTQYTNSWHFIPVISENLNEKIDELISEGMRASYDEPDSYEGMHAIEGEIAMEAHPVAIGPILKGFFGVDSQGFVNSCYQHRFFPATAEFTPERCALPPMTFEVYRDTGSAFLYYDCCVNQVTLEIAQGALIKATAGIIGSQFTWSQKATPSFPAGSYWTWDVISVSLAGTAIDYVSNLTLTMNNNIEGKAYLDMKKYNSRLLRSDFRTFEVSGTMLLSTDAQARIWRAGTQQRLVITATQPNTIQLSHISLEIDIPQLRYTAFPCGLQQGLLEVAFEGKGKMDPTSNYACQITLVNTKAGY
jgi:hypothetical protein